MNVARAELLQVPASRVVNFPNTSTNLSGLSSQVRLRDEAARLEALLRDVEDLSALSPELLERAIKENCWYHVTPFRSSTVRSLEIPEQARILEVGCGGGGLTRYLGERGFHVVALETSEELAECARLRCKGLSNVEVVTGFLEQVLLDQKFDFVICVDPLFVESEFLDPGVQLLTLCRRVLKSTGTLVLAVGNPLHSPGGAHIEPSRDHVRGRGASLEALKQSLTSAGFCECEPYVTFPHHAAPQLLIDAREAKNERVTWLPLLKELYQTTEIAGEEFESWWRGVCRDGLEESLAPGWLILAHAHQVHSVLWNGRPVKHFEATQSAQSSGEVTDCKGIGINPIVVAGEEIAQAVLKAAKPMVNSIRDYKVSLVAADKRMDELAFKERLAKDQARDAQDALIQAEDKFTSEIYKEQESRRVREAELGLVLKQYHSVGAMCHDMREEGRKLRNMVEELKRRYVASEEWGAALSKRVSEAETELHEAKASLAFRISEKLKSLFGKRSAQPLARESQLAKTKLINSLNS